ncbi:hypothetical protein BUE80_DR001467 [Diplocarpon rosae]|nr:hypothetical protein BUE80_DR001467 [Diplocarpon rosae]
MEHVKDSFLDLERHRQLLEENIEKLRQSMLHWQIWEAEYEGLKEEILATKSSPTREGLLALGREYEGQLVTQKELEDILGAKEARTAAQVINLLDRRIDYVEQNVITIEKQIRTAEDKLAAASVISTPDVRNEEGLPLTEIMEELDDEGNVISSRLSTPGSLKPQLLEALEKAGINNLLPDTSNSDRPVPEPNAPASREPPVPGHAIPQPKASTPKKKGVKFTEDTKPGPELEMSQTAKRIEDIMKIAKEQESRPSEPPIIPTNETPKDAALRREMLQYGIDADHGSDPESIMSSSLASAKKSVRFSEELDIFPVAKPPNTSPPTKKQGIAAPVCDIIERNVPTRIGDPVPQRKLSQFKSARAASPDVLNGPLVSSRNEQNKSLSLHPATPSIPKPFSTPIVFRATEGPIRAVPTGPEGKILAPMIVERDIPTSASTLEPDDLDPQLLHQEVASDYHKIRNRMIQRQGGFLKKEESEVVPFTEEEGGPKKVSRFKAARLSRS